MMTHRRLIFMLLGLLMGMMLTQAVVVAQGTRTPDPTSPTDYPLATLTTTSLPNATQTIRIGEQVEVYFDSDDTKEYIFVFQGHAEQAISITMTTTDIGLPYMTLTLPSQRDFTIQGESVGEDIRFALRYYVLPDDGEYRINIRSNGGKRTGLLEVADAVTIPISFYTLVQGTLTDVQDSISYEFTGKANDLFTVDIDTNGFTPIVEIYCGHQVPCGQSTTDDSKSSNQSLVYRLSKAEHYVLIVRTRGQRGTYKLVVGPLQNHPITYGDHVEMDFSTTNIIQQYTFQGQLGDVIQIHVKSDSKIDTQLVLWQSDLLIATDDDSGYDFDPEILNKMLNRDGFYTIILRPYRLGSSGKVSLWLDRSPIVSLDDGAQILQLTPKLTKMIAIFKGVAGERVRLKLQAVEGASSQEIRAEISQNGLEITTASVSGNDSTSIEFVTPKNGRVEIHLTGKTAIQLSVEHLSK